MSFLAALAPTLLSTIGSTIGNAADNTAMSALNQEDEQFQMGMYAQQMQHQEQMQVQSTMFDEAQDERSENKWRKLTTALAPLASPRTNAPSIR